MPFSSDITEDILNNTFDNEQSDKLDILYEKLKETNNIDIQLQIYAIENDNSEQETLGYDITLRWGFWDAISEYLFELERLEIFYKINNVDY